MPDSQPREYNPLINGFSIELGPLDISLNEAKKQFGQFPSRYGFVSETKNQPDQKRRESKALNLKIGHFLKELLETRKMNLKGEVHQFFNAWHRDLDREFGLNTAPFFNINGTRCLQQVLRENNALIERFSCFDVKKQLTDSGLIRKDVLNSIRPDRLLEKSRQMLLKKIQSAGNGQDRIQRLLDDLSSHAVLTQIRQLTGIPLLSLESDLIRGFTDEICESLIKLSRFHPLKGINTLTARTGKGIEFEYATRDDSYLKLGKKTSDCTADKRGFQSDATIENIFWTVFSWILDRNYQILKVYFNNEFVMKIHLLPLFISSAGSPVESQSIVPDRSDFVVLAVDAIETTVAFRGQSEGARRHHLAGYRDEIFIAAMDHITRLADGMNITDIYAEKFSNTPWVRDKFNAYPEIFFHADHIIKIDQLEDVHCLAEELSTRYGHSVPEEVFMEIQMKNTFLQPGYINKAPGVKSFALIRGDAGNGIPMKRIIGV